MWVSSFPFWLNCAWQAQPATEEEKQLVAVQEALVSQTPPHAGISDKVEVYRKVCQQGGYPPLEPPQSWFTDMEMKTLWKWVERARCKGTEDSVKARDVWSRIESLKGDKAPPPPPPVGAQDLWHPSDQKKQQTCCTCTTRT